MTQTITRITKDSAIYPDYNLFFINAIKKRIEAKKFNRASATTDEIFCVITKEYRYCSDTIQLLSRLYSDDKWTFRLETFKSTGFDGSYVYTFAMRRKK